MAVWWVFQNKSYDRSRDGGYLWAPLLDKTGHKKSHWETMADVLPGDVVLSCRDRKIVATSIARSAAYIAEQPNPLDAEFWAGRGRRVDVAYVDLPREIPVDDLVDLLPMLTGKDGPLASTGRGKQGYLFPVSPRAALALFERIDRAADVDQLLAAASDAKPGRVTTANVSTVARVGQQTFRKQVAERWAGKCAVTGADIDSLLIASHIIPWRIANDSERLDPANGLLLEARFDRLFDSGLITFDVDTQILISKRLDAPNRRRLGLDPAMRLARRYPDTDQYLRFHRELLFLP